MKLKEKTKNNLKLLGVGALSLTCAAAGCFIGLESGFYLSEVMGVNIIGAISELLTCGVAGVLYVEIRDRVNKKAGAKVREECEVINSVDNPRVIDKRANAEYIKEQSIKSRLSEYRKDKYAYYKKRFCEKFNDVVSGKFEETVVIVDSKNVEPLTLSAREENLFALAKCG